MPRFGDFCDTSAGDLAGALAVPVWVAIDTIVGWRWRLHREDSPWYPTMRLIRQEQLGAWQSALQRIAAELPRGNPEKMFPFNAGSLRT
jgi:hypothetical protein